MMPKSSAAYIDFEKMEYYKASQKAFVNAIDSGRLSLYEFDINYVGHYMWMGKSASGLHDAFKHRIFRNYLAPLPN